MSDEWHELLRNMAMMSTNTARERIMTHLEQHPEHMNAAFPDDTSPPLVWAMFNCDWMLLQWLLQRGANPNATRGPYGRTPMHTAVFFGNTLPATMLIAAGADLSIRSHAAYTGRIHDRDELTAFGTPLEELLGTMNDDTIDLHNSAMVTWLVWAGSPEPLYGNRRSMKRMFEQRRACARTALLIMGLQRFRKTLLTRDVARLLARAVWESRMEWIKL